MIRESKQSMEKVMKDYNLMLPNSGNNPEPEKNKPKAKPLSQRVKKIAEYLHTINFNDSDSEGFEEKLAMGIFDNVIDPHYVKVLKGSERCFDDLKDPYKRYLMTAIDCMKELYGDNAADDFDEDIMHHMEFEGDYDGDPLYESDLKLIAKHSSNYNGEGLDKKEALKALRDDIFFMLYGWEYEDLPRFSFENEVSMIDDRPEEEKTGKLSNLPPDGEHFIGGGDAVFK